MRDRDHAEVLILHSDASARPRHPRHLAHDAQRLGDVEDDRDGQRGVEAIRGEGEAGGVGDAERDGGAPRGLATQGSRPIEQPPARVDAHHLAPTTDQRGEVANDHAGAAADLEHPLACTHGNELQKAPPQPCLSGRSAPRLEAPRHLFDVGLGVGIAPRIRMAARRARAAGRAGRPLGAARAHVRRVSRRGPGGRTARCRSIEPGRHPRGGWPATSRCRSDTPGP